VNASYTTPALGLSTGPATKSLFDKIVQSWAFMLLLVLAIIGLLVYAVRSIFDPRRDLRQRMGQFVDVAGDDAKLLSREELTLRLREFEQSIERSGRLARFAEDCEIGFVKQPPTTLLLGSFAVTAFLSVILASLWTPWWLILFPLGPVFVVLYVRRRVQTQRKLFAEQLPDNLDVLAQALRVGHSLVGGLSQMANDAAEPSRREFKRVVADEQLGIPLENTMKRVADRMQSHDMEHVALVAMLQRETGGASAEVIDQVSDNIRGRMEVRRLVHTLTAQGRLARWIVSAMPIVLVFAILIIFPQYLDPLFHETVGQIALVFAAILVVAGSLVIKRIVEIKV
jgi:tight adherence protein B